MAADTYCEYTQVAPTDNNKWTISLWFKRAGLGVVENLFAAWQDGSNQTSFRMYADGTFNFFDYQSSSYTGNLVTNRKFQDVGAWMHIVCVWDSDNATPGDRMKMYINGVEEGSVGGYATDTNPSSGQATVLNVASRVMRIGEDYDGNNFDGEMSHIHFIDGTVYDASAFGETDSTSGIWKIKTSPSVTYGNNGFFLKMEDRTNLDLDSGTNDFTFTTSGNLTATYDNPSNNFCLPNNLNKYWSGASDPNWSNGNTTVNFNSSNEGFLDSSMGVAAGKWYWEVEMDSTSGTLANIQAYGGVCGIQPNSTSAAAASKSDGYVYFMSSAAIGNNGSETAAWGTTFSTGDILGIALDITNSKIYFARNGTWMDSGDPTSGATGTGAAYTISATPTSGWYFPVFGKGSTSSYTWKMHTNFGNGYFGTTAVTSANADDAGIGAFEYDVPTGYYTLCTKNIKAYGG